MQSQLRFSLRTLFFAATFSAVACYGLIFPTIIAERFVRAVASAKYERADLCFRDPDDRFLRDLNEKHWRFQARAELEPWSFRQFVRGQRRVGLNVAYGDAGPMRFLKYSVIANRAGLLSPKHSGGFGGGGGIDTPLIPTAPTS